MKRGLNYLLVCFCYSWRPSAECLRDPFLMILQLLLLLLLLFGRFSLRRMLVDLSSNVYTLISMEGFRELTFLEFLIQPARFEQYVSKG